MDELQAANERLKAIRREQGISETVIPERQTSKSQNEKPKETMQAVIEGIERKIKARAIHLVENEHPENEEAAAMTTKLQRQADHPEAYLSGYGVPEKYLKCSFETFQGAEALKKLCMDSGEESILLTGKTGCGKTHIAVAMLRHWVQTTDRELKEYSGEKEVLFVTVPDLFLDIRDTFKGTDITEKQIVDKYSNVPVLVLDDLGAERASEWVESVLYLIIDRRDRGLKRTIITTNLSMNEIKETLGARIESRLSQMRIVDIKLPDYRKKRAS